jgi:predicted nucleic acid-binding protein
MARRVLVDSGPLVALLDGRDLHHKWVQRELANLHQPLVTCEAVLSEVFFLVSRIRHASGSASGAEPPARSESATARRGTAAFIALLRDGLISTSADFSYEKESAEILRHLERFSNVPMSFADACLVRMCEIDRDAIVFTTDRDFLTYRRNRRQPIPLISPF